MGEIKVVAGFSRLPAGVQTFSHGHLSPHLWCFRERLWLLVNSLAAMALAVARAEGASNLLSKAVVTSNVH